MAEPYYQNDYTAQVTDRQYRVGSIHRPRADDARGGLDAGADGKPNNALGHGVVNGPHLFVALE